MQTLRSLCEGLGWPDVRTYIQSGNVVFGSPDNDAAPGAGPGAELETRLESAIRTRFGFEVPVIIRDAARWAAYRAANPFPRESEAEANRVMLLLSKAPPADGAEAAIRERARNGESIARTGDALWIHYPAGAGTTRITPTLLDRCAGSPVTSRNWRTVLALDELLRG